jgi:hypothetical protein
VLGSIYEKNHNLRTPGPVHNTIESSKKTSLCRFPPKSISFGPPKVALVKGGMRGWSRSEVQKLIRRMQAPNENDGEAVGLRSAGARSIYHSVKWDQDRRRRKLQSASADKGWAVKYADCLSVATYAGKVRARVANVQVV